MTVPVWVEEQNGTFTASVPGVSELRAEAASQVSAVEAIRQKLRAAVASGQLVFVDDKPSGLLAAAGKFRDDPTLLDICAEAYRLRDEQKAAEMAEYDRP